MPNKIQLLLLLVNSIFDTGKPLILRIYTEINLLKSHCLLMYGISPQQIILQYSISPLTEPCTHFALNTISNRDYNVQVIELCPIFLAI